MEVNMKSNSNNNYEKNILTAEQVSKYLCIPIRTLYHLTKQGKITGIKIGKKWRYNIQDIEIHKKYGTDFSLKPIRFSNSATIKPAREKRETPRINTNLNCHSTINLFPFKTMEFKGIIKNIGTGGILLYVNETQLKDITTNDPIELQFNLNQKNNKLYANGKVMRKEKDALGIRFKNTDKTTYNLIDEYAK